MKRMNGGRMNGDAASTSLRQFRTALPADRMFKSHSASRLGRPAIVADRPAPFKAPSPGGMRIARLWACSGQARSTKYEIRNTKQPQSQENSKQQTQNGADRWHVGPHFWARPSFRQEWARSAPWEAPTSVNGGDSGAGAGQCTMALAASSALRAWSIRVWMAGVREAFCFSSAAMTLSAASSLLSLM